MTSIPLITPDPEADAARAAGLRKMRTLAVSLLVFAALVYLATLNRDGFWGFVNAGAEASMVGAMADWFAVAALFKHPLGLPIPHTALVPKRKDELGKGLREFVGENFLQEEIIRERVAAAEISARVSEWLADPGNVQWVVNEASEIAAIGVTKIRDEQVADLLGNALIPRFVEEPISPLAGALLTEVVRDDLHRGMVDLALAEVHRWLIANQETFTEILVDRAPWWAPPKLNDAVTSRLHVEAIKWVEEIQNDPHHHARSALDSMLQQLAHDLTFDPDTQERMERLKERVLTHPQTLATGVSLWNAVRRALLGSLQDPQGLVRLRFAQWVDQFGERLREDAKLRGSLDGLAADAAVFVVDRYGQELTTVITHTIERWDGKEAARKIELHVGRDLQFIRINGTIVGGLVGVIIHTIAVLIS